MKRRNYSDHYWLRLVDASEGGLEWPSDDPDFWELKELEAKGLIVIKDTPGLRPWVNITRVKNESTSSTNSN